ncbi:hypothetical protein CLOM_g20542, partial [Closterium sp. NIES-68]
TVDDTPQDIDKICASVPAKLAALIRQYPDIFLDYLPAGLPSERPQDHKIDLEPGAQPTVRTQWRLTQPELTELRSQLDYLLEKGFIRPSTSPFAAPIMFTPKKIGGLRMCIDYRALNRITIKSRYPIPRADDLLDQLRGARFFSKIDLRGIHDDAVWPHECALYIPTDHERRVQRFTRQVRHRYLEDILVFSKTQEQHLKDLDRVFQRLQQNRLISKGSKCEFLKSELDFLGHVVEAEGIKIDSKRITTIRDWNLGPWQK